ncbi:MAG: ABC transporter ATP-binding protein [Actinomycetota bacterium]
MGYPIDAQGMTKIYPSSGEGVSQVDLEVPEGAIVGLIGPSGSGKTTTVRLLTGLLRPDSGSIVVLGSDPARFGGHTRSRIGYLPQVSALYEALTVRENVDFVASLHGLRGRRRARACDRVLAFVEMEDAQDLRVNQISGGMRRRVGLASALVHEPDLMFLDEPTAGLDPILRRRIWEHLSDLGGQGRTLIVTTQYVSEAIYCDYIALLTAGRMIAWGPPEELRRRAYGGELVDVVFAGRVPWPVVDDIAAKVEAMEVDSRGPRSVRLTVADAGSAIPLVTSAADEAGVALVEAERVVPDFDDVFVRMVDSHRSTV